LCVRVIQTLVVLKPPYKGRNASSSIKQLKRKNPRMFARSNLKKKGVLKKLAIKS